MEHIAASLKQADGIHHNAASLSYKAQLQTLKLKDFELMTAFADPDIQRDFYNSVAAMNQLLSSFWNASAGNGR